MEYTVSSLVAQAASTLSTKISTGFYWVSEVEKAIKDVEVKITLWLSILKDLDAKKSKDHIVQRDIRSLIYRLEDIREIFSMKLESSRGRVLIKNLWDCSFSFTDNCTSFSEVRSEVEEINNEIERNVSRVEHLGELETKTIAKEIVYQGIVDKQWLWHPNTLKRAHIIAMEESIKDLNSLMFEEGHGIICIYGIGGIGKSALAEKLLDQHKDSIIFEGLALKKISQNFSSRGVFEDIFKKLLPVMGDKTNHLPQVELARMLCEVQKEKKCLIVLDGMWSVDAWKFLHMAFPTNGTCSKVLITTRIKEVAEYIAGDCPHGSIYPVKPLTMDASYSLFQRIAFLGKLEEVDPLMMELGKKMVRLCKGIPSAIINVANSLATKQTLGDWESVLQDTKSLLSRGVPTEQIGLTQQNPALRYDDLPYHLKPCFLFLGMFPKGCKIEVEHLLLLWMAEGMISLDDCRNNETMMEVAERYLTELVIRNMVEVKVEETSVSRKHRLCCLHEQMRDVFLEKGKEFFFTVMDPQPGTEREGDSSYFSWRESDHARRSSLCLNEQDRIPVHMVSRDVAKYMRSLLLLNTDDLEMNWPQGIFDLSDFRMLRILSFQGFNFRKSHLLSGMTKLFLLRYLSYNGCILETLPRGIRKLKNLRYLSFKGCTLEKLPSSLGSLLSLLVLDLRVKSSITLIIPNVLRKMEKLTHLYFPLKFQTPDTDKLQLDRLDELQVLVNFDTGVCDVADLFNMKNLLYLSITIEKNLKDLERIVNFTNTNSKLASLLVTIKDFDCYTQERRSVISKLLDSRILHSLSMEGHLGKIPNNNVTSSLTEIVLIGSQLKEDPMETLEKLPKLQVLVLQDDAFVGKKMISSASGFAELQCLKLFSLGFLETWEVDNEAMPRLSILVVKNCRKFQMLPNGLRSRVPSVTFDNED